MMWRGQDHRERLSHFSWRRRVWCFSQRSKNFIMVTPPSHRIPGGAWQPPLAQSIWLASREFDPRIYLAGSDRACRHWLRRTLTSIRARAAARASMGMRVAPNRLLIRFGETTQWTIPGESHPHLSQRTERRYVRAIGRPDIASNPLELPRPNPEATPSRSAPPTIRGHSMGMFPVVDVPRRALPGRAWVVEYFGTSGRRLFELAIEPDLWSEARGSSGSASSIAMKISAISSRTASVASSNLYRSPNRACSREERERVRAPISPAAADGFSTPA